MSLIPKARHTSIIIVEHDGQLLDVLHVFALANVHGWIFLDVLTSCGS